jgi:hypothetical protein
MNLTTALRTVRLTALTGAAVLALGAAEASAACKAHKHTAQGASSAIQYLASVSAKNAWKATVKAHDGAAYDSWYKASDKRVACTKSGPGKTWVCMARARPCA